MNTESKASVSVSEIGASSETGESSGEVFYVYLDKDGTSIPECQLPKKVLCDALDDLDNYHEDLALSSSADDLRTDTCHALASVIRALTAISAHLGLGGYEIVEDIMASSLREVRIDR